MSLIPYQFTSSTLFINSYANDKASSQCHSAQQNDRSNESEIPELSQSWHISKYFQGEKNQQDAQRNTEGKNTKHSPGCILMLTSNSSCSKSIEPHRLYFLKTLPFTWSYKVGFINCYFYICTASILSRDQLVGKPLFFVSSCTRQTVSIGMQCMSQPVGLSIHSPLVSVVPTWILLMKPRRKLC